MDTDFSPTLVAVTGLALNASAMSLAAGGATGSLAATLTPANVSNALVAWTSSAPLVAGVDQGGLVTPLSAGTATITAKSVDHPAATAICAVTVLPTYAVTYDANGATGSAPATQTKVQGTGLSLAANSGSLVRSGYTFASWNTLATGLGTSYAAGGTYSADAAVKLYATWAVISYYFVYNLNLNDGLSYASAPETYTIVTPTITLQLPTRTGHTFGGWYTDPGLTASITQIVMGSTGDLSFYAKWTANSYAVTFDGQGGTAPSLVSTSVVYGSTYGTLATTS